MRNDDQGSDPTDLTEARVPDASRKRKLTIKKKSPSASATALMPWVDNPIAVGRGKDDTIAELKTLSGVVQDSYFRAALLLLEVRDKKWFAPHTSLKAFVEAETNLSYRQVCYYMGIAAVMRREGIDWTKFQHVPWTKMRVFSKDLTAENADYWLDQADRHTRRELEDLVPGMQRRSRGGQPRTARSDDRISSPPVHERSHDEGRPGDCDLSGSGDDTASVERDILRLLRGLGHDCAVVVLHRLAREFGGEFILQGAETRLSHGA